MAVCSDAVKFIAEILRREAYRFGEWTEGTKRLQTNEADRKGETTTDDQEAGSSSDHKQEAATASTQRLLAKQKRRVRRRGAQLKARQQRKQR